MGARGQPSRGQITRVEMDAYLQLIAEGKSKTLAAEGVGRTRRAFNYLRQRNEKFAVEEDDAVRGRNDRLLDEIWRRGHDGVEDVKWVGPPKTGREVAFRNHSDKLLELLAKAWMPGLFRENHRVEHTGAHGGPIKTETEVRGVALTDVLDVARRAGAAPEGGQS